VRCVRPLDAEAVLVTSQPTMVECAAPRCTRTIPAVETIDGVWRCPLHGLVALIGKTLVPVDRPYLSGAFRYPPTRESRDAMRRRGWIR
jgi:hypothetical protein